MIRRPQPRCTRTRSGDCAGRPGVRRAAVVMSALDQVRFPVVRAVEVVLSPLLLAVLTPVYGWAAPSDGGTWG